MKIQPLILAAGKGTRMKSPLPKVLCEIAKQPMLAHVINSVGSLPNCTPPVLVTGYKAAEITQRFPEFPAVHQEPQLGTGHAVQMAAEKIQPDAIILVLYGDVPLTRPETLQGVVDAATKTGFGLLTVTMENPAGYGRIVRNSQGKVTSIVEHKDATHEQKQIQEINTGILAAKGENLLRWVNQLSNNNVQGEYYLTDVIAMAVAEGIEIATSQPQHPMEVAGANNRSQLAQLERYYQTRIAEQLMADGATLLDPARIDVRGTLKVSPGVVIDVNCVFEGDVQLGENVTVDSHCVIKNSRIEANSHVREFSHIEGTQIATHATVGPFARLREGTELADNSKVGNFVETKKAKVGKGSKINHLSYVGDAELGKDVNIGAGTITCNYDGANKHKTTLEDDVFIGSNTALVAPVKVGKGATVAAGSTITKNVKNNELALSRSKQTAVDNWKRPTKKGT